MAAMTLVVVADRSSVLTRLSPFPCHGRVVSLNLGCGPFGEGKDVALRAVVVGGGIGGIAAAVALARAGIDVRVYEQAQQLTEVGAGVSLAPNGLRMLERLGVGEGIGRLGARYVSAQLRFSNGRAVRHEPYQFTRPGQNVGIHRADLLALLAGQLPPSPSRPGIGVPVSARRPAARRP